MLDMFVVIIRFCIYMAKLQAYAAARNLCSVQKAYHKYPLNVFKTLSANKREERYVCMCKMCFIHLASHPNSK